MKKGNLKTIRKAQTWLCVEKALLPLSDEGSEKIRLKESQSVFSFSEFIITPFRGGKNESQETRLNIVKASGRVAVWARC